MKVFLKQFCEKLDFSRLQFEKDAYLILAVDKRKRYCLPGAFARKAHLHIWDEPLNFIDVISRMQIEELLLEYLPTMLFVEHDSEFCNNIATRLLNSNFVVRDLFCAV